MEKFLAKINIPDLPINIFKEGNIFVAHCPVLDISSCGDNLEEAHDMLKEALIIFFEELLKKGTFEKAMQELGWIKVKRKYQPSSHFIETKILNTKELVCT